MADTETQDESKTDDEDKAILKLAHERFKGCVEDHEAERAKQIFDLKFATLDQWDAGIRRAREDSSQPGGPRPCLTIDKINQYVVQVVNDMRQNRAAIKVRGIDDASDPGTAEVFQDIARQVEDQSSANIVYETAGQSTVLTGEGYFRFVTEYVDEKSNQQKIVLKMCPNMFCVYLGPHLMPDGSDAEYGFILDDVPTERFKREHPKAKHSNEDFSALEGDAVYWTGAENTIRRVEYFYFDFQPDDVLSLADGNVLLKSEYEKIVGEKPPIEQSRPTKIKTTKWCKLTGLEVLEKRDWAGKYIPIVKVTGKEAWVEGKRKIWGLVRPAIDSLRAYNYWFSAITERLALAPKTPYVGAVGQFQTDAAKWANVNTVNYTHVQYDAIDVNGVAVPPPRRQEPAQIETAMIEQLKIIEHDIQTALAMFNASIGKSQPQQSGKAILALTRESDTGTFHFPDNLANSIRHGGRIIVDLAPKVIDTQQILRLMGEDGKPKSAQVDPTQDVAHRKVTDAAGKVKSIHNLGVGTYDVTVTTGPSYNTKRMEAAELMVKMSEGDPEFKRLFGDLMFREMDWSMADKIADRYQKLLPPQLQEKDGQPPVPPQVAQHVQQLTQAVQQLGQKNQELESGAQAEAAKIAVQAKAKEQEFALSQHEAQREAEFQVWKAKLDASTKVTIAEITAKADMGIELKKAEHAANAEFTKQMLDAGAVDESGAPVASPLSQVMGAQNAHVETLAKVAQVLGSVDQALQQQTAILGQTLGAQQEMLTVMKAPKQVAISGLKKNAAGQITGANVVTH